MKVRLPHNGYNLQKTLNLMEKGMTLKEGEKLAPVKVEMLTKQKNLELWLAFTLSQGINRQIRRMCRDTGLTILTLRRVQQGPLMLGDLPKGQVRELTAEEMLELRQQVELEQMQ